MYQKAEKYSIRNRQDRYLDGDSYTGCSFRTAVPFQQSPKTEDLFATALVCVFNVDRLQRDLEPEGILLSIDLGRTHQLWARNSP